MYRSCGNIDTPINVDTSGITACDNAFSQGGIKEIVEFNTGSASSLPSTFQNSQRLETIGKIILNDNNITFTNTFAHCKGLKNITFEGEIKNSISFAQSTKLTVESMKNIIEHLKRYDETSQQQVLSFAKESWDLLEASGPSPENSSWEDYVNSLGWSTGS